MRKIILTTSLFFCLAITTVLAQITPDGSTNTSTTDSGGVILINIAVPVSGISNNTYSEFNVPVSDVNLNNDVSNPNITVGNRANIIVNQVMGSNPSILEGILRVVGYGAAIILANPNGITCNGCRFITSGDRVDLVTGSYDIATGTYNNISDNDITIESGGFTAEVQTVNIQTNNFTNSGLFYAGSVNFSLAGTFDNSGIIWAANPLDAAVDSINLTATDFINSGTFSATDDSFSATVDTFRNESGATIVAPDGCNIVYTNSYTDNGTSNCISSRVEVDDTIIIDIEEPNSNGLSDNQVDDFDVNSYGTILNNSAGGGTAQLGVIVTSNSNITAGSEASLILLQVTGSTGSALNGTIEVFGTEAGLIIANPNGITCDECAFINANRLDLVTGNNYNANTNRFGFIAAADIDIASSGLDASSVGILNISAGNFNNAGAINANNLNITAAADFSNSATINSDTVTIEVTNFANDIGNAGTVSSDSLNIILTDSFTHSSTSFTNFNNFSNLAISTEGTFTNNNAIDLAGNITITANTFINSNSVTAADNLSVVVSDHFTNSASTLKADNVDIQATGYILNSANGMIEATDNLNIVTATLFNVAAGATVSNGDVGGNIIAANLTIETGALNNINTDGDINGNITVNSFNLSVAGAFDYEGTITTNNAFNLNVGGDFSYNDTNNDFVWGANDTLTVLGNANIVAADFANSGTITVTNSSLNLTATNFTNTGTISANTTLNTTVTSTTGGFNNTGGVVSADTFSLSVAGAFDYITEYLGNGTINNNALNLNVGGDFSNNNSANNFNWGDNDILTVLGTASVVAADFTNSGTISVTNSSLNLTATNFTNAGTISANTTLNTTVTSTVSGSFDNTGGEISATDFALSVAGDFDYVAEYLGNGTITTNALNLNVGGDFSNNDANNDFVWNASDSLVVLGNASVTADSFNNSGTISADALTLSVAGAFDYVADFNGTITTNTLNLNVGGDFSNNDANNDFTWGANDTLTVLGNASIDAASFNNSGTINVINSFDITAAADFANSGIINVTNIFDITAAADFDNSGTISANSFNTTVNTFNNKAGAEITAAECNLVVNTTPYTDNGTITCLDSADDTMVIDIARPDANGLSNNSYETFHIPSNGIVLNNSDSDGTSQLAGDISANTNYSSGDAASIILNQVTGTIISLLVGTLEVFGAEAVVIIANPNGITCNGCAFLNASRVDLVTASSYNFDADSFDSIENTNIAIIDNGLDASSSGILNIQAGGFTNTGVLKANSFNLSVIGDFDNTKKGIINATSFNLNVGGDFSNNDASSDFIWDANEILTVSGSANIVAAGFNNSGIITVTNSSLNLTATDFTNNGTISANTTLNTTVSNTPSGSFNNTGGVLNADTVSLSLAGDFDDTKKGIINANYFNLTVGGSFINNNTNSDFVLAENDSLSILGDFTIATNNYIQFGTIDVAGALNIDADRNFVNHGAITTESLNITTGYTAINHGAITTDSLEITAGYTAINQGSIVSGNLDLITADFFRNLTGGDISTDTLNIIAGGKVTNTANITVGTLTITANNDSSRTNDTTGFYVSNRGNITATTLNIAAVDNFYNRGNITATNFQITRAKSVFFLNREIDSFYAAGHTYDGGDISLAGDSSFIAADGSIENYGNIDLGSFNLDLTANSFTNHEDANVTANTVNLNVSSFVQNGFIDATINQ